MEPVSLVCEDRPVKGNGIIPKTSGLIDQENYKRPGLQDRFSFPKS